MKIFPGIAVIALSAAVMTQPSFAKSATAGSKMSGSDAIFGTTGKCHEGRCSMKKATANEDRRVKHVAHTNKVRS